MIKGLNYKFLILLSTVLACTILAFFVGFIKNETIVYTHFFYVPILLAGVWYRKKAVFIALFLCFVYILVTLFSPHAELYVHIFERSAIFVAVAYVIGLVSEKRAKGEEKLKETKEYLDNIITSSADAIVVVDMDGIVRSWNRAAEDYMGYSAKEVIGTSNKNFFADPGEAEKIMRIVQREGELKNYRTTVLNKDKKPVHISMSAALLKDRNGVPVGTVRVSRDITKEVELEEKIKEERDNLNQILESMDDGVYIVSKDYKVEFMNKVLIDALGYHVGDICYKAFHNRDEPCPRCKNTEVMKGKTVRWEWYSRRNNKTYDLFETPMRNINGTISKLTIFRDISDRKRMEDDLKDAEERYRVIFEHALTALCVIEDGEVVSVANKEFETLSGYSREEIKGKKWIDFIADQDRDRVQNYCVERRKGEAPACCEFKFVSSNGEIKHVNAWIEPIPGADSCIASLLDVTELKRKEDELRETCEKLAELDKMKRDFLNVAYHEMRSPLAPIVGYASMLERCELPDKGKKYLYNIEHSARELEKLINRMLELARIDGKKIELSLEGVYIPEVVAEVVKDIEPEAREKKQVISMAVQEVEIQADRQKIVAIFSNLISNAIKYTPEGGKIDIVVEDRGEDIRAYVADTGIGITEEHLPKIFERFYMVDTSLTRKSGSLGLGLSIVKEYVKLHGGKVWATSEIGKGSKFFFIMPKRQ
ncbi:MAG: PAS domain S-box protein [Methanophagales archaeon]|nr:PAS domain S-box protein [Methanophagales archaeon]MCW3141086.1 PAS domain S-box protein [Methanophagales archaeon]